LKETLPLGKGPLKETLPRGKMINTGNLSFRSSRRHLCILFVWAY